MSLRCSAEAVAGDARRVGRLGALAAWWRVDGSRRPRRRRQLHATRCSGTLRTPRESLARPTTPTTASSSRCALRPVRRGSAVGRPRRVRVAEPVAPSRQSPGRDRMGARPGDGGCTLGLRIVATCFALAAWRQRRGQVGPGAIPGPTRRPRARTILGTAIQTALRRRPPAGHRRWRGAARRPPARLRSVAAYSALASVSPKTRRGAAYHARPPTETTADHDLYRRASPFQPCSGLRPATTSTARAEPTSHGAGASNRNPSAFFRPL